MDGTYNTRDKGVDDQDVLRIFTSGMSLHVGTKSHLGVYSVWIGHGHSGNQAWWTKEGTITNQYMELAGVNAGLEAIMTMESSKASDASDASDASARKRIIYSTSHYVLNCMTKWLPRWEKTGWMTKQKKKVHNGVMLKHMADISSECNVEFVRIPPSALEKDSVHTHTIDPSIIDGMLHARDAMMHAAAEGTHSKGCTKQRGQMTCEWSG